MKSLPTQQLVLFFVAILLFVLPAYAGHTNIIAEGDFIRVELPIKRVGNLILVEAEVDSVKGNFILDTGAPYLILNSRYFKGQQREIDKVAHDIIGRKMVVHTLGLQRLTLGELYYQNITADLADLSAVEELRSVKILGALGVGLFLEMELELNLAENMLTIHRLRSDGERIVAANAPREGELQYSIPFLLRDNVILIQSEVGGHLLSFCFDTGAEAVVLGTDLDPAIYRTALQLAGCLPLTGANGASSYVHYGRLTAIKFGRVFHNVNVIVADLKGLERSYGPIDGIVGYDLLAEDVIDLNFPKQEITLRSLVTP